MAKQENLKYRRMFGETCKLSSRIEYCTFNIVIVDPDRLIVILTEGLWMLN